MREVNNKISNPSRTLWTPKLDSSTVLLTKLERHICLLLKAFMSPLNPKNDLVNGGTVMTIVFRVYARSLHLISDLYHISVTVQCNTVDDFSVPSTIL